jgi:hypothetical protein
VAYNEGAVWEYGWLIEFTEEGSSNSGSVESERTNIFVVIINKEIDLILNQYYLQARDPKVGAYCVWGWKSRYVVGAGVPLRLG